MRERAKKAIIIGTVLLALGCAYLLLYSKIGIGIPCFFNLITGLKCPGCGATRMLKSLALLDFKAAFGFNPVLLIMLPLILFFFGKYLYQWIKNGKSKNSRADNIIQIIMIASLLIFGIVRNIYSI